MSDYPLPSNEETRLADLQAHRILDTLPEQAYDDITRLAAQICDTPIALVSFVDDNRQWFKSRIGVDFSETSREVAFCAHAIVDQESLFVVPDATIDTRFAANPMVTADPKIRFYAGAPLVTESGHAVGTLCVMDRKPRLLTTDQRRALEALARQVVSQLSLRQALFHIHEQQRQLQEAMQQRDTVVAAVAHELRTPLTAVVGFIDIVRDSDAGLSPDDRREYLSTAARQAGELSHIIDDLLVAARLEQNTLKVTRVPVNLQAQIAQVLEGVEAPSDKTIRSATAPVRAWGDPSRVRQIVRNLITNALRYGGSEITVSTGHDTEVATVAVQDNGEPIPVGEVDSIFEPYRVSAERKPAAASMGLGLAISRQLAQLMGGDITYDRDESQSTFRLALPIHD